MSCRNNRVIIDVTDPTCAAAFSKSSFTSTIILRKVGLIVEGSLVSHAPVFLLPNCFRVCRLLAEKQREMMKWMDTCSLMHVLFRTSSIVSTSCMHCSLSNMSFYFRRLFVDFVCYDLIAFRRISSAFSRKNVVDATHLSF